MRHFREKVLQIGMRYYYFFILKVHPATRQGTLSHFNLHIIIQSDNPQNLLQANSCKPFFQQTKLYKL